jgi:HK97 gp10 family phage protein
MAEPLINVTIANLDQIVSAFNRAPGLMRAALPKAINQALMSIGGQAAINAPVRTGTLRRSILNPAQGLTLASTQTLIGSVGSGTGYGLFVEQGTKFMAAQPYLQPAVDEKADQVQKFFTDAVQSVLNIIAGSTR